MPEIRSQEMTCVGLSLELLRRLSALDSRLTKFAFIASCEELVENVPSYTQCEPNKITTEKEHVIVALKFRVGGRNGVLLLDPGYHIARVITVMEDSKYPHSGWFTQSEEGQVKKEYNYSFPTSCKNYILWKVKQTRFQKETVEENLVYIGHPFLNPVNLTERRNLVYNFRSWLARNTKGQITAGIYFPVLSDGLGHFTLIYSDSLSLKQRLKLPFSKFLSNEELSKEEKEGIELCGNQLSLGKGQMLKNIKSIAAVLSDSSFKMQILQINDEIKMFEVPENV